MIRLNIDILAFSLTTSDTTSFAYPYIDNMWLLKPNIHPRIFLILLFPPSLTTSALGHPIGWSPKPHLSSFLSVAMLATSMVLTPITCPLDELGHWVISNNAIIIVSNRNCASDLNVCADSPKSTCFVGDLRPGRPTRCNKELQVADALLVARLVRRCNQVLPQHELDSGKEQVLKHSKCWGEGTSFSDNLFYLQMM